MMNCSISRPCVYIPVYSFWVVEVNKIEASDLKESYTCLLLVLEGFNAVPVNSSQKRDEDSVKLVFGVGRPIYQD